MCNSSDNISNSSNPDNTSLVSSVKQVFKGFLGRENQNPNKPGLVLDGTCFCVGECCCTSKNKPDLLTAAPTTKTCIVCSDSENMTSEIVDAIYSVTAPEAHVSEPTLLRRRASNVFVPLDENAKPTPSSLGSKSLQTSLEETPSNDLALQRREERHDIGAQALGSLGIVNLMSPACGCLHFLRVLLAYSHVF